MIHRTVAAIRGNLVAWLALFVALGGTSLAASHYVINSTKQINPKVIKKLKGNHGARGATGLTGPTGPRGPQGAAGTPGTTSVFSKTESDARYLAAGATAADSAKLGGTPAGEYTFGAGAQGGRWQELVNGSEEASFLAIPGIGELSVKCHTSPETTEVKLLGEAENVFYMWQRVPAGAAPATMESGNLNSEHKSLTQSFTNSPEHGDGQMLIQASNVAASPSDTFATITVSSSVVETVCRFQANYTLATKKFG